MANNRDFKVNDRVKRSDNTGVLGTIKDIRMEITSTSGNTKDRGVIIAVLWDNSSYSYFTPDALVTVNS